MGATTKVPDGVKVYAPGSRNPVKAGGEVSEKLITKKVLDNAAESAKYKKEAEAVSLKNIEVRKENQVKRIKKQEDMKKDAQDVINKNRDKAAGKDTDSAKVEETKETKETKTPPNTNTTGK